MFRMWLDGATPTEEMWQVVIEEDEQHDYSLPQIGNEAQLVQSEVNVYTSSGTSDRPENELGDNDLDGEIDDD